MEKKDNSNYQWMQLQLRFQMGVEKHRQLKLPLEAVTAQTFNES